MQFGDLCVISWPSWPSALHGHVFTDAVDSSSDSDSIFVDFLLQAGVLSERIASGTAQWCSCLGRTARRRFSILRASFQLSCIHCIIGKHQALKWYTVTRIPEILGSILPIIYRPHPVKVHRPIRHESLALQEIYRPYCYRN